MALLVAALWLGWAALVSPMLDGLAQDRESIARSRQLLARTRQLAAAVPALERQRDAPRAVAGDKAFLQDASPSLMAAGMQAAVQRLVASAGVALHSSRTLPGAREDGFARVGIELDIGASAPGLTRLLHAIATAEPAILVEKLAVRVPENGAAPAAADGQPAFGVHLQLVSYARPAGAATAR